MSRQRREKEKNGRRSHDRGPDPFRRSGGAAEGYDPTGCAQRVDHYSLFSSLEERFLQRNVSKVPSFIKPDHLTLMTLLWGLLVLLACYGARKNVQWMWLASLVVVLQWLTDYFDGAVGRYRKTGLVTWGFYMDHLLDYVFYYCVILGYRIVAPGGMEWHFYILFGLLGFYFMHIYLSFGATKRLQISFYGVGPTEWHLVFVLMNAGIVFFGNGWLRPFVEGIIVFMACFLLYLSYKTQRRLWDLDMRFKEEQGLS